MKFENYTAMDYYDKAFALDVSGKAKGAGETYEQAAMNVWRSLTKTYPLTDLDALEDLIGTTERNVEGYKAAIDFINKLAEKGETVTTDDLAAVFDFRGLGDGEIARHIVLAKSGKMRSGSPARSARNKTVSHAQEILSKAILVEIQPTKHSDGPYKTTGRDAVHSYRFIIPVTFRGKPQVLVITAEGFNNDVLNKLNEVSLYEVYNRKIPLSEADIAGLSENGILEGKSPSAYTLAQLLSNVKDLHGKPYVIDGEVQFDKDIVLDMKNPALYQEAANAQTAAERLQADAKAWKETLKGAWAGKLAETQMFRVMETPLVLQLVGAKALPIYMSQGKLMKIKKEHPEIKKALLNKLPEQLADPMMIFQSETVPGRIVVCLELKDEAGVNIVVPIELNAKQNSVEINVLTSIYGRGTEDHTEVQYTWFLNNVRQGRAVYVNKKQAVNFYQAAGLQLPMVGREFDDLFGYSIKTETDLVKEKMKNPALYQATHGETMMLQNGRRIVSLFERADESTFLHELGHVFLDDLQKLAAFDEVSQRELSTVDAWAAWHEGAAKEYENTPWAKEFKAHEAAILKAKKSGDAKALEKALAVWRHERFARAFERYLKEGEAPARGLKQVFRKFAAFLRSIYRVFTSDGGRASNEVERVMDRMIATDEEIETAAQDKRHQDITAAGGEKLFTESDKETYQRWYEKGKAEAKERLARTVERKMKGERRKKMEAEIESEEERFRETLYHAPIHRARQAVEMAQDEKAALLFYEDLEAYRAADRTEPMLGELVEEHMTAYRREKEQELLASAITPEEVERAMASPKYYALRLSFEAEAFRRQAKALRRLGGRTRAAMDEVEARIEGLAEEPGAEEKGESLTKEEVTARIKEAVQEMDEKDIPKIAIEDAHRFDSLGEQALFDIALQEMKKLTDGKITDPLGNEVYFAPGDTETLESYGMLPVKRTVKNIKILWSTDSSVGQFSTIKV